MASEQELKSDIERLRAENEALKKPARGHMYLKVSEKGAISVYGLGRFPITLYRSQWDQLVAAIPDLQAFMTINAALLSTKD